MSRLLTILVCSAMAMNLVGCGTELVAGEETASEESDIRMIYVQEEQIESSNVNDESSNIGEFLYESYFASEEERSEDDIEGMEEPEEPEEIIIVEDAETEIPDDQQDELDEETAIVEEEPESSFQYQLTEDEEILLQKIAFAEARSEGMDCMATVMCVILNRVEDVRFPDSISGVIYQSGQFSPVSNGSFAAAEPDEATQQALEIVESGWDESQGALYFESCSGSSWHSRNLTYLFAIGNMRFYK